jgi:hypothetical protein
MLRLRRRGRRTPIVRTLPRTYDRLEHSGVRFSATLATSTRPAATASFLTDAVRDGRRMSPVRRALAAVRHGDRVA